MPCSSGPTDVDIMARAKGVIVPARSATTGSETRRNGEIRTIHVSYRVCISKGRLSAKLITTCRGVCKTTSLAFDISIMIEARWIAISILWYGGTFGEKACSMKGMAHWLNCSEFKTMNGWIDTSCYITVLWSAIAPILIISFGNTLINCASWPTVVTWKYWKPIKLSILCCCHLSTYESKRR